MIPLKITKILEIIKTTIFNYSCKRDPFTVQPWANIRSTLLINFVCSFLESSWQGGEMGPQSKSNSQPK